MRAHQQMFAILALTGALSCVEKTSGGHESDDEWVAVDNRQPVSPDAPVAVTHLSAAGVLPGQELRIRGRGFGDDPQKVLIELQAGYGDQSRRHWIRPAQVSEELARVVVPGDLFGRGYLSVWSGQGQSNRALLTALIGQRNRIRLLDLTVDKTTILTENGPLPGDSVRVLLDGRSLSSVSVPEPNVVEAASLFAVAGDYDVVVEVNGALGVPYMRVAPRPVSR